MTNDEKIDAIRARIYGEYDNKNLAKIGSVSISAIEDIIFIINHKD